MFERWFRGPSQAEVDGFLEGVENLNRAAQRTEAARASYERSVAALEDMETIFGFQDDLRGLKLRLAKINLNLVNAAPKQRGKLNTEKAEVEAQMAAVETAIREWNKHYGN